MSASDRWLVVFGLGWAGLIGAFFAAHLPGWAYLWMAIAVLVGIGELWSKLATGKTLTQKFRARFQSQKWMGYVLLLAMLLVWMALLFHLGWPR